MLGTKGLDGKRLSEVWGTAEADTLVHSHLKCLDKALAGYVKFGMVINLGKSDLLQEDIGAYFRPAGLDGDATGGGRPGAGVGLGQAGG